MYRYTKALQGEGDGGGLVSDDVGGGGGNNDAAGAAVPEARLGMQQAPITPLPLADRIQIGCYAPKQRVGPCTSNYFVASR